MEVNRELPESRRRSRRVGARHRSARACARARVPLARGPHGEDHVRRVVRRRPRRSTRAAQASRRAPETQCPGSRSHSETVAPARRRSGRESACRERPSARGRTVPRSSRHRRVSTVAAGGAGVVGSVVSRARRRARGRPIIFDSSPKPGVGARRRRLAVFGHRARHGVVDLRARRVPRARRAIGVHARSSLEGTRRTSNFATNGCGRRSRGRRRRQPSSRPRNGSDSCPPTRDAFIQAPGAASKNATRPGTADPVGEHLRPHQAGP